MKSFILLKKFYRFGGVLQFAPNRCGRYTTILINCIYYAICITLFLSTFWYFSFGARTFSEYVECSYFFVSSLLMASWYSVYLWRRSEYVDLFSTLDAIIEESEYWVATDPVSWHWKKYRKLCYSRFLLNNRKCKSNCQHHLPKHQCQSRKTDKFIIYADDTDVGAVLHHFTHRNTDCQIHHQRLFEGRFWTNVPGYVSDLEAILLWDRWEVFSLIHQKNHSVFQCSVFLCVQGIPLTGTRRRAFYCVLALKHLPYLPEDR